MGRKRKCPAPGTRKYGSKTRYKEDTLKKALADIKHCKMSQRLASEHYGIPRSTLKYKLKELHSGQVGKPPVLTKEEESSIVSHVIVLADIGIPIGMLDVRCIVKKYLDDKNTKIKQFKNNLPGWEWGKLFLERHPCIKEKVAHNISRKRAQVNLDMIRTYFDNLGKEIENVPPSNIFNFDETGFHDDPKKQKVLFRRNCRNPEVIRNSTKSCFTEMFCGNAEGEFVPPYIIYKAKQKWSDWLLGAPPGTRMAVTPTGWIDAETFDDWFEHQLLPVLKKKEGKKVLIGDNLSSHITPKCLRLCDENNIRFICLIPNSTHLLQPLDVSYFSSLKRNWRDVLRHWRSTKRGKITNALPKQVFATLLSRTIDAGKETAAQNISAGFRACGIQPFNPDAVLIKLKDYSKPIEEIQEAIGESFKSYIANIRDQDLQVKQTRKFQIPVVAGKSVSVEEVEKYYKEREEKEKSKATKKSKTSVTSSNSAEPAKKRGRPVGSKNKTKTDDRSSRTHTTSPVSEPSNVPSFALHTNINPTPSISTFDDQLPLDPDVPLSVDKEVEIETTLRPSSSLPTNTSPIPSTSASNELLLLDHDIPLPGDLEVETEAPLFFEEINQLSPRPLQATLASDPNLPINQVSMECEVIYAGEYEARDGVLKKKNEPHTKELKKKASEERKGKENTTYSGYCVVNVEECLFPARIISQNGQSVKISVMMKAYNGWKWPSKPEIVTCSIRDIVSHLENSKITQQSDSIVIDDNFLSMEWGN